MKTLISAIALATLTATSGIAATMSPVDANAIQRVVPGAQLGALNSEQVRALSALAAQSDLDRQPGMVEFIRSILRG